MSALPVSTAGVREGVISQVPQLCSTLISPDYNLHTLAGSQGAGAAGMSPCWHRLSTPLDPICSYRVDEMFATE